MTDDGQTEVQAEFARIEGALDLLFDLRETFAQWVEEAEDASKQEALDNVLNHIVSVESAFRNRRDELRNRVRGS